MTQLTLINHAAVLLAHGSVRCVCDPWIEGSAFDDGWDLLVPTPFRYEDFRDITHIWFSHEHPDHFSPSNLRQIPEDIRRRIVVLYQDARDGKVAGFCRQLGFRVEVLRPGRVLPLSDQVRVRIGVRAPYDSWLLWETDQERILNLNDCEIRIREDVASLAAEVGPIDVLLTQFSYANWNGNPDQPEQRAAAAQMILDRMVLQATGLGARFVIPFASLIRFSHAENAYMNDRVNTVEAAATALRTRTPVAPIVLYPGDAWECGAPHDNGPALERYAAAYAEDPPRHAAAPCSDTDVVELARTYVERVRRRNNPWVVRGLTWAGVIPSVTTQVSDWRRAFRFHPLSGLTPLADVEHPADLTVTSSALAFLLRYEWGVDTLYVNARFSVGPQGLSRFLRAFSVGVLNNTGRSLGFRLLLDPAFCWYAVVNLFRILSRLRLTRSPSPAGTEAGPGGGP